MPDLAIERLKNELTDKYVIVTGDRPELARFEGFVGVVKTVNFSGRALVEFTGFHNNPAWFDIDPACLRIVDEPPKPDPLAAKAARPASKVPVKQAAGASAAEVLAAIRGGGKAAPKPDAAGRTPAAAAPVAKTGSPKQADAAKKVSPSVGQSTADILAAARGGTKASQQPAAREAKVEGAKGEGKRTSPAVGLSTADVLAAARGKKPTPPTDSSKKPPAPRPSGMTTEEILAAARAAKKPAAEAAKTSAIDELAATSKKTETRRHLTAEDIRDIGLGKLSIRREPVIATTPLHKKPRPESAAPQIEALPKKVEHSNYTAADIQKLGLRK